MKIFNLKKFAQSNPSVPGAVAPVGGAKPESDGILDQLDNKAQSTGNEEAEASKRVKELTADYNNAYRNYQKEEYTFKKTEEAFNELKDSPFAKVAPFGIKDGCSKLGEMFNNVMEPEEIADIYQQFVTAYEKLPRLKQIVQDELDKASIAITSDPKAKTQGTEFIADAENKINQIVQDNNLLQVKFMKQQRLFTQFNLLYKDMFTYYSVMSQLCQVKTKYETDVKNFKFGNNEDWQAILGYYEYLISLLQVMAPKAVQVVPKNAANIQNVYKNLINEIQGEINELSMAPLKQMYGGGR
jgi:hypothetical protein